MRKKIRRLELSRETVRELSRKELEGAAGGATTTILSLPASACPCISMGAGVCTQDSC